MAFVEDAGGLLTTGRRAVAASMTVEQFKIRFITVILSVWIVVVGASLFAYLFRSGPLPDPVLLGIPTGTWLAVFPPLPRAKDANASQPELP